MHKINELKITCSGCGSITTIKTSSEIFQGTNIGGKCVLCNTAIGKQIFEVRDIINKYNDCCEKLSKLSNIEIAYEKSE